MSLTEKMFVLSGTLWLTVIAFIVYMWLSQAKQQLVWRYIAQKLSEIEKNLKQQKPQEKRQNEVPAEKKQDAVVTISKNEPMSKYETVNLPDEAEIKFVD